MSGLIKKPDAVTPEGFRETNSGLLVPAEISRERETWTEEEAKIVERATKIVNARGWFLTMTCSHERCRAQPIVQGHQIAGGQVLECQHKTVTVIKPPTGKPNAAIQRRRQALAAQQIERAVLPMAKAFNAATMPSDEDNRQINGQD